MKVEDIKKFGNELLNKPVRCKYTGIEVTGYITEVYNDTTIEGVKYCGVHVVFDKAVIWGDLEYCSHDYLVNMTRVENLGEDWNKELETVELL